MLVIKFSIITIAFHLTTKKAWNLTLSEEEVLVYPTIETKQAHARLKQA